MARASDELAETAATINKAGGRALALTADVTDRIAVEAAVADVERHLGPLELPINNAGVAGPTGS